MNRRRKVRSVKSNQKFQIPNNIKYIAFSVLGLVLLVIILLFSSNVISLYTIKIKSLDGNTVDLNAFNTHVNILLASISPNNVMNDISILSIDKNSATLLSFGNNVYVVNNGNPITLNTIYAISHLQEQNSSVKLLESLITQNTYIPIDGYVFIRSQSSLLTSLINLQKRKINTSNINPLWVIANGRDIKTTINNNVYTNLDLNSLYYMVSALSSKLPINTLSPQASDFTQVKGVNEINTNNFVSDISSNLSDSYLTSEHARISIYNATGIPGIADYIANILKNQGAIIDFVGTSDTPSQSTQIYSVDSTNFPYTTSKLKNTLHGNLVTKSHAQASDFTVIVGNNILNYFNNI